MNIPEELIDAYAYDAEIESCKFNMMGKMLDLNYIKDRIALLEDSELYIYGGGYLGIQLYRAASLFVKVPSVVDKRGKLQLNLPEIPVINIPEFKKTYRNQNVIITPFAYYHEIRKDLLFFVPENKLLFLGEFLGGILG